MNTEYENKVAAIEAVKKSFDLIMSGEGLQSTEGLSAGDTFQIANWQWVDLAEPAMNSYSNGHSETDHCGIKKDGEVTILGFTENEAQALVEYTFSGDTLGTPCPSGAKFFLSISRLKTIDKLFPTVFSAYSLISSPHDGDHNKEYYAELRRLMESVDPAAVGYRGNTPAHVAAQYNLPLAIADLKSRGADLNARNDNGGTPIGTAIVTFNYDTTRALLENGACLDTRPIYWGSEELTPMETLDFRIRIDSPNPEREQLRDSIVELVSSQNWPVCDSL